MGIISFREVMTTRACFAVTGGRTRGVIILGEVCYRLGIPGGGVVGLVMLLGSDHVLRPSVHFGAA